MPGEVAHRPVGVVIPRVRFLDRATTSLARVKNGIAAATARAAWGVGFQAIATRSKFGGIAEAAGIRIGRPLSSRTLSRIERAMTSSPVARSATIRSAATP
jgi:hypothetical protein